LPTPPGPVNREQPELARAQLRDSAVVLELPADERGRRDGQGLGVRRAGPRSRIGDARREGRPVFGPRPGGCSGQGCPVLLVQGQRLGQGADGVRVGAAPLAALEGADGLRGQAGASGELLLAERRGKPPAAQPNGQLARTYRRTVHAPER
jgi:hypothetical protein